MSRTFVLKLNQINDIVMETEMAQVFKDTYPKAQCHYLIVCKEDVANVGALTQDHIELLDHMKELANQIIEQQHLPSSNFLIGFKMDAVMYRLTMHVISDDFYSESMKRVQHWNSFNTDLFITYQAVYALLRVGGSVEPLSAERATELRSTKLLHCNQCDFQSESFLHLKVHLFNHWRAREQKLEIKQQVDKVIDMLDKSKLDDVSTKDVAQICESETISKEKPTNCRQNSNPQVKVNNNSQAEHVKPGEQHASWRQQARYFQSTDQQTPSLYCNDFSRRVQNFVNNCPRQHFNNSPQESNRMPLFNNFVRMPNTQQRQNPHLPMQLNHIRQQQQGHPQPNRPHFNPFRQTPNQQKVGVNQNNGFKPQHPQSQNSVESRTNKANPNKLNWKSNPTKNWNYKGPENASNHGKIMQGTHKPSPKNFDSASSSQGQNQFKAPYNNNFASKRNENYQKEQK